MIEEIPDRLCLTCGHAESQHYQYILNGNTQTRCKMCDPVKDRISRDQWNVACNLAMTEGSEFHRLYHFADHDFVPMLPLV